MEGRRRAPAVPFPHRGAVDLRVDELIGGYYRQVGVVWNGGATLETLTS